MIELKTLYIIETKDKITKISFGYRMPLGVNPGAIRFTNDIENAAMFKSKEDAEKENEKIFLKKKQRQGKPEAAQQPEKLPEKQRKPLLPAPAMAKRKRRPDGRRSRYCGNRISAC